jgi:eukaryotic-like serine/threonine-protein kinase
MDRPQYYHGTSETGRLMQLTASILKPVTGGGTMIGLTISHYEILEKLGEGGMGVVYKARDTSLDRIVALKFLTPAGGVGDKLKERLLREAQAVAQLDHPNICTVHEIGEKDGMPFIVMAFIEGETLGEKLESGPLAFKSAADYARQIACGLQAAHRKQITHRDIKSTNIIITPDGQVKIMDFGLAKFAGRTQLTQEGSTAGTVMYMSPEQARGDEVDHRTDIWSLGVVLYEMLTGRLPFQSEYETAAVYSILNEEPPPVGKFNPDVPAGLEAIVVKALQKNRDDRYQQIEELLADLEVFMGNATAGDHLEKVFAGRYYMLEELGKGGMGQVYKALDREIDEKIALKLLNPGIAAYCNTIERFPSELRAAVQLSHKNICRIYHIGNDEGRHYITMEYVCGEDLKSMIRMMGRLSPGQAVSIAEQICEGLAEAHRLGVVHRDLKPQNIMIDREGSVKIMDFGIARSFAAKGMAGAGAMIGTPEYMAPEQVEGKEAGEGTDIYALGIILFEMLTGSVPFECETALGVALKHKTEPPPDPRAVNPQISEELGRVILRCLEKEVEKRYQKAEDLRTDLTKIGEDVPAAEKALPVGRSVTSKEWTAATRRRWKAAAAVAAAAVIVLAVILFLMPAKPAPQPGKTMLAVLPFENLGPPEDEYFADGITDEIIARLTGVAKLGVIARNSSMQYKKTDKPLKQVGEELGVAFIVSGTIRWQKAEDATGRVRVTPTLIRAGDATQLWANVYDESFTEIFQVQSDISKKLVDALGIALLEPEKEALEAKPTQNMEAYEYYLRGIDFGSREENERELRNCIEMYEKAVSLDPGFYQAYANLAQAQAMYYWMHFDRSSERLAKAKDAAENAFRINHGAPEAHTALGYYYYQGELDYEQALKHFMLALGKQPNNTEALEGIGYVKRRQGKFEETIEYLKSASELDPRSHAIAQNIATTHVPLRNYIDAEKWIDRAIFLKNDYESLYIYKVDLFINQGETIKARQVIEDASRAIESPTRNLFSHREALLDILEGKYQAALDRFTSEPSEAFSNQFYFVPKANLVAKIYGLMKNRLMETSSYEAALKLLEEKIEEDPDDSRYHSALGIAMAGLGQKSEAVQAARRATEILPIYKEAWRGAYRATDLALVYTMVGEYDEALDLLEHLLSIPGDISITLLKTDPAWAPLRSLPRFRNLTEKFQRKLADGGRS